MVVAGPFTRLKKKQGTVDRIGGALLRFNKVAIDDSQAFRDGGKHDEAFTFPALHKNCCAIFVVRVVPSAASVGGS